MITFSDESFKLIKAELEHIPAEYQKPFNSKHEGLAVLQEEFEELKDEIFFGRKKAIQEMSLVGVDPSDLHDIAEQNWRAEIKKEAVQVAAMAVRIIQELTN